MIDDAALPILSDLSSEALSKMTGVPNTGLLRLRYRQGKRAILHVTSPAGEGALWAFAGDKGRRIARRNRGSRLDDQTGTVFDPFPNDHRLPEIAALLRSWQAVAPALIGTDPASGLQMLRYRPGLSCTFRAKGRDGSTSYIKVIADEDVEELALANAAFRRTLSGTGLDIASTLGTLPELKTIAYEAAQGTPLERLLMESDPERAMQASLTALETLNALPAMAGRQKAVDELLSVAYAARDMVVTVFPALADASEQTLQRLIEVPHMDLRQIHGDMKLEHVFLNDSRVTLIDTETMSIGPAAYDRAMLDGRLVMAAQDGMPLETARRARSFMLQRRDVAFDWCRAVVALRLAKFHAQHPEPGAEARAAELLREMP